MSRILADENVHADIVGGLRGAGNDVLFAPEHGLAGVPDEDLLAFGARNDLILLTGDKDFGGLIEYGTHVSVGRVLLLRYRLVRCDAIAEDIQRVLEREATLLGGPGNVVIVLSEGRYRIRRVHP